MKKIYLLATVGLLAISASAAPGNGGKKDRKADKNTHRSIDRNAEKNGKGYGPYDNPGQGNKYGLYKDKTAKKDKSQKIKKDKSQEVKKEKSQKPYENRGQK